MKTNQQSTEMRRQKHERITRINSAVARDINRAIILNSIRRQQPISRTQISEITRLNKSTVSSIVNHLIGEGWLSEMVNSDGLVGRNRVNLSLRKGTNYVGAVYFDAPVTRLAIVDIDGTVCVQDEIKTSAVPADQLVDEAVARMHKMRTTLAAHRFHGVGASVAGIVNASQASVVYAANLEWHNVELGDLMRKRLPDVDHIEIENDAKSSALAELLLGRYALEAKDVVFLTIGAGIGAGVMVHGRILSGSTHAAGEIGHMTVVDGGERCGCGNRGCWELYASERAPVRAFAKAKGLNEEAQKGLTIVEVVSAARAGDEAARTVLLTWGQHVGVGIGNVIAMIDPEAVIVGGSIAPIWDLVSSEIHTAAHDWGTFARQRTTTILPTSFREPPALMGGAALAIRRIFHDYSLT